MLIDYRVTIAAALAGACVQMPEFVGDPVVVTDELPGARGATPYEAALEADSGTPPYRWSEVLLPPGLSLDSGGQISGVPSAAGEYDVVAVVADSTGATTVAVLPLVVEANLDISADSLPSRHPFDGYEVVLEVLGGTPPYAFEVEGLPNSLAFEAVDRASQPDPLEPGIELVRIATRRDAPAVTEVQSAAVTIVVEDDAGVVSDPIVLELPTVAIASVAAGRNHTCALDEPGQAFCWGSNGSGRLGNGNEGGTEAVPVPIDGEASLSAISAGTAHTCALDEEGRASCWGDNRFGQLGAGSDSESSPVPVPASGGRSFVSIGAGHRFSCALDQEGTAWCWGDDSSGQLGDERDGNSNVPVEVVGQVEFVALAVGRSHACALDEDGQAWCWGANTDGQLGRCDEDAEGFCTAPDQNPVPIEIEADLVLEAIAAGGLHSCGIDDQGQAWCWGRNAAGQLGDGGGVASPVPVQVSGGHSFRYIAAGESHTCAGDSTDERGTWCWGDNTSGQLGDGGDSGDSSPAPVRVSSDRVFASSVGGGSHSCAVDIGDDDRGVAFCWGSNDSAQLGSASGSLIRVPVPVEPSTD